MKLVTVGPAHEPSEFWVALEQAVNAFGPDLRLVLAQIPWGQEMDVYAASLARIRAPVFCSTGGMAFTERACSGNGAVAGLLGGTDLTVDTSYVNNLSDDTASKLQAALLPLFPRAAPNVTIITLFEASKCDGDLLASLLRKHTPLHCRHIGGSATDRGTFKGPRILVDGRLIADAAAFAAVVTPEPILIGARHGRTVAENPREMIVTANRGNVLLTLDGRPALDVYLEELARLGEVKGGESEAEIRDLLSRRGLGITTPFGERLLIRAAIGQGPEKRSIVLAGGVPSGATVRILDEPSVDHLIQAARGVTDGFSGRLRELHGRIAFDCGVRARQIGKRYGEEWHALGGGQRVPTLGFTTYGEIARGPGLMDGYHNCTVAMAAW